MKISRKIKNLSSEKHSYTEERYINKSNECRLKYLLPYFEKTSKDIDANEFDAFACAKHYLFLGKVLDKDIKFVEKACIKATQEELDKALTKVEPNNFKAINILLNHGAKLHKVWTEDDGWGYMVNRDEIDEIGTKLLKKKIKEALGEK